ncbi:MAG: hypothetical protein J5641_02375 [Bacteroidales bacterium]|nr:hypothetical protein [Bacteroidales bacterium]
MATRAQQLYTGNSLLDDAFRLAVWTLDTNTHHGIIHAGGGYGGEWTRDCAINCWNAASLLRPHVAECSLWSVTDDSLLIGHQYWDKIIWTLAAWNHYLLTGDTLFLHKSFACAARTMAALESICFNSARGLFMGPAVFQDGIAGYDEPVYDPRKWDDSYVLHHPHSDSILCLSTNALYYQSYRTLASMAGQCGRCDLERIYQHKARLLRKAFRRTFLQPDGTLLYLIDHQGRGHAYQEGLGVAFTMLFDLLTPAESQRLLQHLYVSPHGIPCVYPSFPRNTPDRPGRHNMMIWPHVNMFFASACAHQGTFAPFYFEMKNLADLAINRGGGNFYEIYTLDGEPSGGWQCGALWDKKEHQTWCATGFLRLFVNHVFGITPMPDGLELNPIGMEDGTECTLSHFRYRDADITIVVRGHGDRVKRCLLNGRPSRPFIPADTKGTVLVEIQL